MTDSETSRAPRVSFVSLGCPTALVDSERSLTRLRAEGHTLAKSLAGADLAIVNACALRGLNTNSPVRRHGRRLACRQPGLAFA